MLCTVKRRYSIIRIAFVRRVRSMFQYSRFSFVGTGKCDEEHYNNILCIFSVIRRAVFQYQLFENKTRKRLKRNVGNFPPFQRTYKCESSRSHVPTNTSTLYSRAVNISICEYSDVYSSLVYLQLVNNARR